MEIPINTESLADKLTEQARDHLPNLSAHSTADISVTPIPSPLIDTTFSSATSLSTSVLNASIHSFSDQWFAEASNLLNPAKPIWKEGYYVHAGKWYDGWETRRHNTAEYDWVVIKLGVVCVIEGVEVDTAFFKGNEAPEAGLDAAFVEEGKEGEVKGGQGEWIGWEEVLPKQTCGPSQRQAWRVKGKGVEEKEVNFLKLKMYPDGGIARLRVYGRVVSPPLPVKVREGGEERPQEDLAAALNGGVAVARSDEHFGTKSNLLLPGRGKDMGDGWETSRSRTKGHVDWVIVKLGLKGRVIEKVVVDTKDFRGNFPRAVKVEGWSESAAKAALGTEEEPKHDGPGWRELVKGEQKCQSDHEHVFEGDALAVQQPPEGEVWTHVKMTIIPDGGVKRLRIFGRRA
ncbi:Allantoicase [Cyphellophora attinorum]|uniref:allantoicase n=1 Tax=Cyphellophora attinorum TaxID=1664694 RepID=A0A0N0NN93_9EURO|nr:Allantoicase [Phialophora attinorum]KPI41258.1 Allantoicase [Phialophora attinorum]